MGQSLAQSPAATPAAATPAAATPRIIKPEEVAPLEKVLDGALAAYNAGDAAAFNACFASEAHPPATEPNFRALFEGIYKVEFGKYVSKKLLLAETYPDANHGQIAYDATFEKRTRVKLSADFSRQDGVLKIVQLRLEKM